MFGLGVGELTILLVIVVLLFGAGSLPEAMGSLGKGIRSFRRGLNEPPEIDMAPEDLPPQRGQRA